MVDLLATIATMVGQERGHQTRKVEQLALKEVLKVPMEQLAQ